MHALQIASWRIAVAGRWTARIAGTLLFLLFLAFFFGEGPPDLSRLTSTERRQFKEVFVPKQMAPEGSFPAELERTKPYGYSIFQLDNMATLRSEEHTS